MHCQSNLSCIAFRLSHDSHRTPFALHDACFLALLRQIVFNKSFYFTKLLYGISRPLTIQRHIHVEIPLDRGKRKEKVTTLTGKQKKWWSSLSSDFIMERIYLFSSLYLAIYRVCYKAHKMTNY
jgi:hypothetical protein